MHVDATDVLCVAISTNSAAIVVERSQADRARRGKYGERVRATRTHSSSEDTDRASPQSFNLTNRISQLSTYEKHVPSSVSSTPCITAPNILPPDA